nr:tyrosine-type recombinase/integrase [Ancylobacter aquaticus]
MLAPDLLDLLRRRWKERRPQDWLFPCRDPGQPITTRQLDRACRMAASVARLDKRVFIHTLRHNRIAGGDLAVVSAAYGLGATPHWVGDPSGHPAKAPGVETRCPIPELASSTCHKRFSHMRNSCSRLIRFPVSTRKNVHPAVR